MKILVLGCGSIGKRHIRNLLSLNIRGIAVCDINKQRLDDLQKEFSVECFNDVTYALSRGKFDAAFVCTPPSFHISQTLQLLEAGLHCFIEKPLSNELRGVDELIEIAEKRQKVVMVGYPLRFSSSLKRIKKLIEEGAIGKALSLRASVGYYLPYWRPSEDYRKGYGARRDMGGGIILDASHEIDYVKYLLGEVDEVFAVSKKISDLEIDTEDFAEVMLHHKTGAYSQIHLDYLQSNYRRSCEIIGSKGMLLWDINERNLKQYDLKDKEYHVYYEGLNANINEMYIEEIKHFFRCVEGLDKPSIDLADGKRLQEIILKIKESSDARQVLSV